jgi:hypothetical protein
MTGKSSKGVTLEALMQEKKFTPVNLLSHLWSFTEGRWNEYETKKPINVGFVGAYDLNNFYNSLHTVARMQGNASGLVENDRLPLETIIKRKKSELDDRNIFVKDFLMYTPSKIVNIFALNYEQDEETFKLNIDKAAICRIVNADFDKKFAKRLYNFEDTIAKQIDKLAMNKEEKEIMINGKIKFVDYDEGEVVKRRFYEEATLTSYISTYSNSYATVKQKLELQPNFYEVENINIVLPYKVDLTDVEFVRDLMYYFYNRRKKFKVLPLINSLCVEAAMQEVYSNLLEEGNIYYLPSLKSLPLNAIMFRKLLQEQKEGEPFLDSWENMYALAKDVLEQVLKNIQNRKEDQIKREAYFLCKYFVKKTFVEALVDYKKSHLVPYRFLLKYFKM